jgi:hypothetical protein
VIDDFPVAEAVEGFVVAVLALGTARTQPESIRKPWLAVVAVALTVAWSFDLAPGRLALVGIGALALAFTPELELRVFGGFVAAAALATTLPISLDASWRLVALAAVAVVVTLLVESDTDGLDASVLVLAAATVGGFLALPDTERVAFVAGVMAALVLATVVVRWRSVTTLGLALVGALVVWAGVVDSRGRPQSVVSVLAPLSLLISLALVRRWSRRPPLIVVIVVAGGLAAYSGRVAGLRTETREAVVLAGAAAIVGSVVLVAAAFTRPRLSGREGVGRSQG